MFILILVVTFFFGWFFANNLELSLYRLEKIAFSIIVGFILFTWILFLSAMSAGYNWGIAIALLLAVFFYHFKKKKKTKILSLNKNEQISLYSLIIIWAIILSQLFSSHMLKIKDGGWYSGGGTWGDLALHSTLISKFAYQDYFELKNPVYSLESTNYPFLINFYAGQLVRYGSSIQFSLIITGFSLSISAIVILFFLVFRITKRPITSWFFSLVFLCNGGIGVYYFLLDWIQSKKSLFHFLFAMEKEYAHLAEFNLRWSNIVADYLLPQRSFVSGLAIFSVCLWLFFHFFAAKSKKKQSKKKTRKVILSITLLISLTPFFNIHAFLALSGLLAFVGIYFFQKNKLTYADWLTAFAMLFVVVTPQLLWQLSKEGTTSFLSFRWGWMKEVDESIVSFWLKNMGITFIFLTFGNTYFFLKKKSNFVKVITAALLILFLITNIVIFQPHDYDNMKLMLFSFVGTAITTSILLSDLWKKNIFFQIISLLLVVTISITGILSILRETYTSWLMLDNKKVEIAKKVREIVPSNSVILTATNHNHPVPMLTGNTIVMGYPGWLWTHGISYQQTEKDIRKIFQGSSETPNLLQRYHVEYVFIGPNELAEMKANNEYFINNHLLLFNDESYSIYQVKSIE